MLQSKVRAAVLSGLLILAATGPAARAEAPPLNGTFADNFTLLTPPVPAPLEVFADLAGRRVHLADFAGRVVLVNFWATWCGPCIREMPALDRLQAALRAEGLVVLAVSLDRGGVDVIEPFARRLGLRELDLYLDTKGTLARAFGITGLPTTFLIDRDGRVVGAMQGPAEWDAPEALELLRYYLDQSSATQRQNAATATTAETAQVSSD